jgi:hypothetical protein
MANTIVTPSWVTKETARGYVNNLKFVACINKEYSDSYIQSGAKVGNTVNVRMPVRFTATHGQAFQQQNIFESTVPVTLNDQVNVGMGWSSAQATTEIDMVRDRYVKPAADSLANAVDVSAFSTVFLDVWNSVGTPGTTPSTTITYLQALTKLIDQSAPTKGICAVLDPLAMTTIANTAAALFNPSATQSENYRDGMFGRRQLGIDEWYYDQNVQSYTTGTFTTSTPLVNGASQTGASLITDGWASGATTLNKGDIFTVGGVFSVNPQSYNSTGRLQQFVVTATISDTTGDMTIAISPSIITSGQLQTVSNSPANNAVITVVGATAAASGTLTATGTPQSLVFHPDAFTLASADLSTPSGGAKSSFVRSKQYGISIRWVEQYDILNDQNPSRFDILIGPATLQARLAVRVQG